MRRAVPTGEFELTFVAALAPVASNWPRARWRIAGEFSAPLPARTRSSSSQGLTAHTSSPDRRASSHLCERSVLLPLGGDGAERYTSMAGWRRCVLTDRDPRRSGGGPP